LFSRQLVCAAVVTSNLGGTPQILLFYIIL
jgi:hypothetical protein